MSRPVRARGLKPKLHILGDAYIKSRPVRARGLKLNQCKIIPQHHIVAPRAGAWIETLGVGGGGRGLGVAPRAGAWIETSASVANVRRAVCRAPCGRVD